MDRKQILDLIISIFRPTIAKALSYPLLMAGLSILCQPLWLDVLNLLLSTQNMYPAIKGPISHTDEYIGWILLAGSLLIFGVEVWRLDRANRVQNKDEIINAVNNLPLATVDLVLQGISRNSFPAASIIDDRIIQLSSEIKKLRFFGNFPTEEKAIQLSNSILNGELTGGTSTVKAVALAQCARYRSINEDVVHAKKCLTESKNIISTPEATIAEAFILAAEFEFENAIKHLSAHNSPLFYSAILMLRARWSGQQSALDWFNSSQLTVDQLDEDGKTVYVQCLIGVGHWERALEVADEMYDPELEKSPALLQLLAFTFLTNAIKDVALREIVLRHIPFAADRFPLADDTNSINLRSKAIRFFVMCKDAANKLEFSSVAKRADDYVLWLELRDSSTSASAKARLEESFATSSVNSLSRLPIAFAFGVELDYDKIEIEVNRQTILHGIDQPELSLARFVLTFTRGEASLIVDYIRVHRKQLQVSVDKLTLAMLEIEALAKSGLVQDAEDLLKELESSGELGDELTNIKSIIEVEKGKDPIALAIDKFLQSNKTNDLSELVDLLAISKLKEKYHFYAEKLFHSTKTEFAAVHLANAKSILNMFPDLHGFLVENSDLLRISVALQFHWAWSLFRKGDLANANEQLKSLKLLNRFDLDTESLEIQISIYSGSWESLSILIEKSWGNRERLSAKKMIQMAHLAKIILPGRATQILEYITNKNSEDPQILASAYFTATSMGQEDNSQAGNWLNKAVLLSGEDGPLMRASFQDLVEMISSNREQNRKIIGMYESGSAPLFMIAEHLNKSLSDFLLIRLFENNKCTDIRDKIAVPIFSGSREIKIIQGDRIVMDASSALVLSSVNLLDLFIDQFEKIYIPLSLIRWLYDEKQKVGYHQPSQIAKAILFEGYITDGLITVIEQKNIDSPDLALNVGDELAFLLEHAKKESSAAKQVLVSCSYPVYKVDSFLEQTVNLSDFNGVLISCTTLVNKLNDTGAITNDEYRKAIDYLSERDKEWPEKNVITNGALIILDYTSISHLMHVGLIDRFKLAGVRIGVHKAEYLTFQRLRKYESSILKADEHIEKIRRSLSHGLDVGKVAFAEMQLSEFNMKSNTHRDVHPTEEILRVSNDCHAVLMDDRYFNQHEFISINDNKLPIYSTLDFIHTISLKKAISNEKKYNLITTLREHGFGFISVTEDELIFFLKQSNIVNGELQLPKELKILKNNLSLWKVSSLISIPRDIAWLINTSRSILGALKKQWADDAIIELSRARSDWLFELLDYKGWAHFYTYKGLDGIAHIGDVQEISELLLAPSDISREVRLQYQSWVDENVLLPLKGKDPVSFNGLIESVKISASSVLSEIV